MHHLNFFASTALLLFLLLACPNMVTAARNDAVPATDAPCIVPAIAYTNGSAEMTLCVQVRIRFMRARQSLDHLPDGTYFFIHLLTSPTKCGGRSETTSGRPRCT